MAAPASAISRTEHGQRRQFDKVSTAESTCIPMQIANMQASETQYDSQGRTIHQPNSGFASLRSDCWNSPLCPRNMPTNNINQGILPHSCGGSAESTTQHVKSTGENGSPTTEVSIQSPPNAMSKSPKSSGQGVLPEQDRPSLKRARIAQSSVSTDIKPDIDDEASPVLSPQVSANTPRATPGGGGSHAASKEKRLPHHVIERRYRENLNSQIESLRAAVPSTSACLTLDMEDIGNSNASSAIRPLSKAAVIAHAAEYMRQLSAQNDEVDRMNRELRVTVEALRRLVNCEDCGVVQQIVDAGA